MRNKFLTPDSRFIKKFKQYLRRQKHPTEEAAYKVISDLMEHSYLEHVEQDGLPQLSEIGNALDIMCNEIETLNHVAAENGYNMDHNAAGLVAYFKQTDFGKSYFKAQSKEGLLSLYRKTPTGLAWMEQGAPLN